MKYLAFFLLLFTISCRTTTPPTTPDELKHQITQRLTDIEGDFAIAFQNLSDSSEQVLINADERFHAASTMKTPVLIEIFKQAETGRFSLDDSITIHNTFSSIVDGSAFTMEVSEDSETELYHHMGAKYSFYDLAYQMIIKSSNLATNILIDYVGAEEVTKSMRELGADSIEVLRGVEDLKAFDAGLSNTTTARDLLVIFDRLAKKDFLSEAGHDRIISILKDQVYDEMIPAKLPEEADVAHKTGWITGVHHDSGIVYMPDGQSFVLVFLSKNAPDRDAVIDASADIALMCYNFLASKK